MTSHAVNFARSGSGIRNLVAAKSCEIRLFYFLHCLIAIKYRLRNAHNRELKSNVYLFSVVHSLNDFCR